LTLYRHAWNTQQKLWIKTPEQERIDREEEEKRRKEREEELRKAAEEKEKAAQGAA
jgi:hypothetical protein